MKFKVVHELDGLVSVLVTEEGPKTNEKGHAVAHNQLDPIREGSTGSVGEIGEILEVEDNRHMLIHHDDDSV